MIYLHKGPIRRALEEYIGSSSSQALSDYTVRRLPKERIVLLHHSLKMVLTAQEHHQHVTHTASLLYAEG